MKNFSILLLLMVISSIAWAGENNLRSLRGDLPLEAASAQTSAKVWQGGDGKIQRSFVQQPPLVPHLIEGFTIDLEGNSCLNCHNWNSEMPGATRVAVSHFVNRDDQALSNISPNRYFCTQCHVPQKDAKPLISNTFKALAEE